MRKEKKEKKTHSIFSFKKKQKKIPSFTADPVSDYAAIRRELALYNPDYLSRPHIVALNKADLFLPSSAEEEEEEEEGGSNVDDDDVDGSSAAKKKNNNNNNKARLHDPNASPPIPELAQQIRSAAADVFEEAVLGRDDSDDSEGDDDDDDDEEEGEKGDGERTAAKAKAAKAPSPAPASPAAAASDSLPRAVVWTSADSDLGLEELRQALAEALASTAGKPAPGSARQHRRNSSSSFGQRATRRARREEALSAELAAGRRGKDYEEAESDLDW